MTLLLQFIESVMCLSLKDPLIISDVYLDQNNCHFMPETIALPFDDTFERKYYRYHCI